MTVFGAHFSLAATGDRPTLQPVLRFPLALWRGMRVAVSGRYRPERHYMRGPGPKHRAKAMAPKGGGSVGICRG